MINSPLLPQTREKRFTCIGTYLNNFVSKSMKICDCKNIIKTWIIVLNRKRTFLASCRHRVNQNSSQHWSEFARSSRLFRRQKLRTRFKRACAHYSGSRVLPVLFLPAYLTVVVKTTSIRYPTDPFHLLRLTIIRNRADLDACHSLR